MTFLEVVEQLRLQKEEREYLTSLEERLKGLAAEQPRYDLIAAKLMNNLNEQGIIFLQKMRFERGESVYVRGGVIEIGEEEVIFDGYRGKVVSGGMNTDTNQPCYLVELDNPEQLPEQYQAFCRRINPTGRIGRAILSFDEWFVRKELTPSTMALPETKQAYDDFISKLIETGERKDYLYENLSIYFMRRNHHKVYEHIKSGSIMKARFQQALIRSLAKREEEVSIFLPSITFADGEEVHLECRLSWEWFEDIRKYEVAKKIDYSPHRISEARTIEIYEDGIDSLVQEIVPQLRHFGWEYPQIKSFFGDFLMEDAQSSLYKIILQEADDVAQSLRRELEDFVSNRPDFTRMLHDIVKETSTLLDDELQTDDAVMGVGTYLGKDIEDRMGVLKYIDKGMERGKPEGHTPYNFGVHWDELFWEENDQYRFLGNLIQWAQAGHGAYMQREHLKPLPLVSEKNISTSGEYLTLVEGLYQQIGMRRLKSTLSRKEALKYAIKVVRRVEKENYLEDYLQRGSSLDEKLQAFVDEYRDVLRTPLPENAGRAVRIIAEFISKNLPKVVD